MLAAMSFTPRRSAACGGYPSPAVARSRSSRAARVGAPFGFGFVACVVDAIVLTDKHNQGEDPERCRLPSLALAHLIFDPLAVSFGQGVRENYEQHVQLRRLGGALNGVLQEPGLLQLPMALVLDAAPLVVVVEDREGLPDLPVRKQNEVGGPPLGVRPPILV